MTIKAILACDDNYGIGKDGTLPWPHNPADLKWFKESTTDCAIVMGRNTWVSLPKKPLPNRTNVVITSIENRNIENADFVFCDNVNDRIVSLSQDYPVWIIGGTKLILSCINLIDEFHLSRIKGSYDCDTFLPGTLIEENYSLTSSGLNNNVYVDVWSKIK
jgi:dihydrofolate reductase|tara:strand:- start:560 stop:1042 length:483 start_codon:yes stop_codon:yes gene_type:complete